MKKLSIRHIPINYKISRRDKVDEKKLIEEMKERVKVDPAVIEKFKKYDVPIDKIDDVDVSFDDLDVSAKTKHKKIYLNKNMLDPNSDVKDPSSYLAHEITHYLQQLTGNVQGHQEVREYLDKPTEMEAFQVQVDFKERHEGEEEAEKYIEDLLDHHEIEDKKKRKEKKDELKKGHKL